MSAGAAPRRDKRTRAQKARAAAADAGFAAFAAGGPVAERDGAAGMRGAALYAAYLETAAGEPMSAQAFGRRARARWTATANRKRPTVYPGLEKRA